MPVFIPENLLERRLECPTCRHQMPIPFLQPQETVLEPIRPNDFHPVTNNVHWAIASTSVKCERCKGDITVPLPIVTHKADIHLFADEAARTIDGKNVWVFCAVGCEKTRLPKIEAQVQQCKAQLISSRQPTEWTMHMKEVWSGDARAKHEVFKVLSREAVKKYVARAARRTRSCSAWKALLRRREWAEAGNRYPSTAVSLADVLRQAAEF